MTEGSEEKLKSFTNRGVALPNQLSSSSVLPARPVSLPTGARETMPCGSLGKHMVHVKKGGDVALARVSYYSASSAGALGHSVSPALDRSVRVLTSVESGSLGRAIPSSSPSCSHGSSCTSISSITTATNLRSASAASTCTSLSTTHSCNRHSGFNGYIDRLNDVLKRLTSLTERVELMTREQTQQRAMLQQLFTDRKAEVSNNSNYPYNPYNPNIHTS